MEIKDRDNVVVFKDARKLCDSTFSEIYVKDGLAIKKYDDITSDYYTRLKKEVFDILKDVDSCCFIKLRNCFLEEIQLFEEDDVVYNLTGYTSDFVRKSMTKMIDKPMDYTLHTLYEFKHILNYLKKHNIAIEDPHDKNCIVSTDGLVIIDPDLYEKNSYFVDSNIEMINTYIVDRWCKEYGLCGMDRMRMIYNLFKVDSLDDYLTVLTKRMDEKTPRDLIEKTLKMR